jgi:hypothetical protein
VRRLRGAGSWCLSATGIGFSVILSRQGMQHSSRSACRPPRTRMIGPCRVSTFRTNQIDRGGCLLYPGKRWCPPGRLTVTDQHSSLRSGQSLNLNPAEGFRLAGLTLTRHQTEVHSRSPVRSSPCPVAPGRNGNPWASPPSFTPRRYQQRMSERGQVNGH